MINTTELKGFLPHRDEMVWVDHVISPTECLVKADQKKHYFTGEYVRQSSFIEWIAQSYGFCRAYEKKISGDESGLSAAYMVSFNKVKFSEQSIKDQEEVFIEVSLSDKMGAISIVNGKVYSKDKDIIYCEASVKLYSE